MTWGGGKRKVGDWKTWQVVWQGKVRLLNIVNPSRDFWIVYGLEEDEDEEGEEMKFNRRSPAAKYPHLARRKQIQTAVPAIETAVHGGA